MGCDIHGPFIEQPWYYVKAGQNGMVDPADPDAVVGQWHLVAELDWDRDYSVFSVLADVRNDDPPQPTLPGVPKGMPWEAGFGSVVPGYGACSYQYRAEYMGDDGSGPHLQVGELFNPPCHSHSWVTRDELIAAMELYETQTGRRSSDMHIAEAIMTIAELERPGHPTRMLFCFDS
jgi:hypothetical protein